MKVYGLNELRRMYLEFFESKDHLRLNSFSLVPQNDKSLLLINSGMAPLNHTLQDKRFLQEKELPLVKNVSVQGILRMLERLHVTLHSSRCLVISLSVITSRKKRLRGHGSS